MLPYFIILLVYILVEPVLTYFTKNTELAIIVKIIITASLLIYYRRYFRFRIKFDFVAILIGVLIAALWIFLDPFYFHVKTVPSFSMTAIILKLLAGVAIAPVVEEFFTRFFLARWIIAKDFTAVPLGKFSVLSFVVTVLFFGLSHDRWLAGIVAGILFNILFYYRKNIESCVLSHAAANLALGIYVIYFGQWGFW